MTFIPHCEISIISCFIENGSTNNKPKGNSSAHPRPFSPSLSERVGRVEYEHQEWILSHLQKCSKVDMLVKDLHSQAQTQGNMLTDHLCLDPLFRLNLKLQVPQ